MSFLGKLGFTRREKTVICIMALVLLAGSVVSFYRNDHSTGSWEVLSEEDSVKVERLQEISGSVQQKPDGSNQAESIKNKSSFTFPININSATVEELKLLPGIGSVLAERIVGYRSENGAFTSIDSLIKVPGIGAKRLDSIKDKITLLKPRMER